MLVVGLVGCLPDRESASGPDAYRHQATPIELDRHIVDEVSARDGDTTDWKSFTLSYGADVVVEVVFADDRTEATVGLYDIHGMLVVEDTKERSDSPRVILKGSLPAGTNFIRIRAAPKQASEYTLRVKVLETHLPPPE